MKSFILTFILSFTGLLVTAQTYEVKGTVTDAFGEPLPGVTILVKDTSKGASTDFDGNFVIADVNNGETLVFSYIGFLTKEIVITNANPLTVQLDEDTQSLEEVVVIGYGTQKKKDLTGAVSVVGAETLEELKPVDAALALQGTTAGVTVNTASGSPGGDVNILIRGVSSNSNNNPLVIVDGYEGSLNSINSEDIETITVLKDAQAAIYGIKGANGVILVTTKAGKKNMAPKVTYNMYAGFQETTKKLDYLNATEYASLLNESYGVNGQELPFSNISSLGRGIDWQEELFEDAFMMNHNVGLSGGGENVTYYLGASNLSQDGIIASDKSNFEKSNIKINLGVDINEKLKASTTLNYFYQERESIAENGLGSVLFNALNFAPTYGLDDQDLTGFLGNEVINPLSQIANTYNAYNGSSLEGNFKLEYKPIEGLAITSRIGFKTYSDKGKSFAPIVNYGSGKVFNTDRSSVSQNQTNSHSYTWETFATYNKTILDNHNASLTVGTSVQKNWGDGLYGTGYDVPNNSWEFADISLATGISETKTSDSYTFDSRLTSFFGRLQYNFDGKYLLSAMLRRDASSDFAPDNRVDYFSSATAGWVISDEKFMEDHKLINFLKLRGSYGTLGNNAGGNLYKATLSGEGTYVFDNAITTGVATGLLPNTLASWEVAEKLDIGLDVKLFDNKFEIIADYFLEDRNDLLISNFPVSGIIGTSAPGASNPTVNAGTTRNKGVELVLNFKDDLSDDFSYGISYNVTKVDGEVIEINGDVIPEGGNFSVGQLAPSRMEVGQPIGYFYGLQTNGIFQNQSEVDAHPSQLALGSEAVPGDLRYVDVNGDGEITFDDRTYIGKPQADYYMGLNLNFNYKNFDFSTYMYAEIGKEMVRNYERSQPNVNRLNLYLDRWHGEGTSTTVPRVTTGASTNWLFSDFYVEDASFFRVQNIQLGYTLPEDLLEKIGMKKIRIYTTVNNAFTFTDYKGYDPAATSGAAIGGGIDYGFYPISRQFLLGLNVTF